jgi:hypothetical protein
MTEFETALKSTYEIDLTTTGRVSGRLTSRPVWFVRQGGKLFLLPVSGSQSQWYKNLLKTPAIRLSASGSEYSINAAPVTAADDVGQVIELFRAKYGAGEVAKYYPDPDVAVEIAL